MGFMQIYKFCIYVLDGSALKLFVFKITNSNKFVEQSNIINKKYHHAKCSEPRLQKQLLKL